MLVIHDTGAHGNAMGFDYNSKLRWGELLYEDGTVMQIHHAERFDDYDGSMYGFVNAVGVTKQVA